MTVSERLAGMTWEQRLEYIVGMQDEQELWEIYHSVLALRALLGYADAPLGADILGALRAENERQRIELAKGPVELPQDEEATP